jgi:hypothetical protein
MIGFTQVTDLMPVNIVGNALLRALLFRITRDFTQESNPSLVLSLDVGKSLYAKEVGTNTRRDTPNPRTDPSHVPSMDALFVLSANMTKSDTP